MPTQKKKLLEEPPPGKNETVSLILNFILGYTPGPPVYYTQPQQPIPEASFPNDYLILSLFSIICCFWPVGVIALLKSIETRCYCQNGRLAEAQASSRKAKTFNTIFIGIGVTYHIFLAIVILVTIIVADAKRGLPGLTKALLTLLLYLHYLRSNNFMSSVEHL
ncbi:PREDICTED: proline-rich transmembrane protein 1-like [Amphimedon queenslandica]|uniref:Uncharacterized protein n=1 Tax=Amphimedon queenslandica TaxID=400682 RepID=A0AAN0JYX8_AMPQE|nr:PREDICTED: proline-rich transmembrane protein 1-like [Amphimedon queenslandica]|eukprot:XP_019862117.1 PREDICTED: proline-rich transmembrane protein 1-like [Amphimedon queenslandica]